MRSREVKAGVFLSQALDTHHTMHEESTEIFRPSKRPRVQRRRAAIEHDTYSDGENDRCRSPLEAELPLVEENEAPLSIADILRRRKDAQRRKGGLEFSLDATANPTSTSSTTLAATPKQAPRSPSEQIMTTRFAPQTGLVTEETDKHMYVVPAAFPRRW